MKRNIIISVIIGTLATYLPFWQWDGLQVAGAIALSMLAWMLLQGTEPEGRRHERWRISRARNFSCNLDSLITEKLMSSNVA